MSLYSKFKTNKSLERDGIYYEFDTTRVKLARAGGSNDKFNSAMESINAQHGRAIKNRLMNNDKAIAMLATAYAETVIISWETKIDGAWVSGIDVDEKDLLPATAENIAKVLVDLPDMFMNIQEIASDHSLYLQSIIDGAAKN